MNLRKVISILIGFGTIGLLSSVLAKLQGMFFPSSLQIFTDPNLASTGTLQFTIKLLCVLVSCVLGGMLTTGIGGSIRENLIVGGLIILVTAWLWVSTIHPFIFWLSLVSGVLPAVLLGRKVMYTIQTRAPVLRKRNSGADS
jgi:hypothetical protein